jgi:WS/DGAT/MGAT family acyltransferase
MRALMASHSKPDRLSALDWSFLALDSPDAPLHVGWTMRFDGEPPSLAALRRHLDARLGLVPRFRRRVSMPAHGLGDPRWVDDASFDIARHVHELTLSAPGGAAELRELAGTLLSQPLDPGRPLWRLYLVRTSGAGFAIIGQAHHALVDGIAAIEVAMLLFGPEADDAPTGETAWRPARDGSLPAAARDALRTRAGGAIDLARALSVSAAHEARSSAGALSDLLRQAPPTAIDQATGPARVVAFAGAPLDGLKAAGRRHSATLNDVLLAACMLALGRALSARGDHPESLKVLVPVSTRSGDAAELGNEIGFLAVDLPIGEADAVAALRTVRDRMREAKASGGASGMAALAGAADMLPAAAVGAAARLAWRKAGFNVVISNVPGPPIELALLGRPLRSVHPAVPVPPGRALSIGAISYLGRLHVGLYADAGVLPDLPDLAMDLERALDTLRIEAPLAPTPWRARAATRRARPAARVSR